MDVEIVHNQVNGLGLGILQRQLKHDLCELETRAVRRRIGKMTSCLRLASAEGVGCSAPWVLAIPAGFPAWFGRRSRPDIGVKGDRLEGSSSECVGSTAPAPDGTASRYLATNFC